MPAHHVFGAKSVITGLLFLSIAGSLGWAAGASPCASQTTVRHAGDMGEYLPHVASLTLVAAHHDRRGMVQLVRATATSVGIVHALKLTVDRRRPDGHSRSFPSGHTAMAFTGAGFMQRRYGWAVGGPAYAVAGFVGWSRIYSDKHWMSDVLVGAAIGVGSSLVLTDRCEHLIVAPTVGSGSPGLSVSLAW